NSFQKTLAIGGADPVVYRSSSRLQGRQNPGWPALSRARKASTAGRGDGDTERGSPRAAFTSSSPPTMLRLEQAASAFYIGVTNIGDIDSEPARLQSRAFVFPEAWNKTPLDLSFLVRDRGGSPKAVQRSTQYVLRCCSDPFDLETLRSEKPVD